jgi:Dyp-type peroxidase family
MSPQPHRSNSSWGLAADTARDTQGIVVTGFGDLPAAEALFLRQVVNGGEWVRTLERVAPVSDAVKLETRPERATALAFTCIGLHRLGLQDLSTFAIPFQEGMRQPDRSRRLGDNAAALVDGRMAWSGRAHAEPREGLEVDALLLLYAKTPEDARAWAGDVLATLAPQVVCERRLSLDLHLDGRNLAREHFGFTDGLSQPIPCGEAIVFDDGSRVPKDPWHGVAAGDILLGHMNAHHEPSPGPYVPETLEGAAARLHRDDAPEGYLDLGKNGSYLVVRELQQDVAAFWRSLDQGADAIKLRNPAATHVTAEWLAERIVGRNRDGDLLYPDGFVKPSPEGPANDRGYIHADPFGIGCPMGSHVRRANPRDGLAKDPATAQTLLDAANNHRILRRGRKYGAPAQGDLRQPDGVDRGLLFMCLNTDLARQFEFVQQTWLLNRNFANLFDETDPLVGPRGTFTVHDQPLRRRITVDTFIRMAGGDYFFLPSLPALRYLRSLA